MLGNRDVRGPRARLRLLPPEKLLQTGRVDHADWNYRPLLGHIQRTRFSLAEALLPPHPVDRLLEIGYGSGVFLTQLAHDSRELHGIDIHSRHEEVARVLASFGIAARLQQGAAEQTPYAAAFFDVVVAVSTLEFVTDVGQVCREVRRILRPDGCFVVVTPGRSALVDFGLRVLTGKNARDDFGDGRERIRAALPQFFEEEARLVYPPFGGAAVRLYDAFRLRPKPP